MVSTASGFASVTALGPTLGAAFSAALVATWATGLTPTLLRDTARTLLQDHDVYITDWHNARDVSLQHGAFSLDDYIE